MSFDWEEKTLQAACEVWSLDEIIDNGLDNYCLLENVNNDYDLGHYWIEESGCYDLNTIGNLKYYIDYEAFGRDVRLESNGEFSSLGWIEYCG